MTSVAGYSACVADRHCFLWNGEPGEERPASLACVCRSRQIRFRGHLDGSFLNTYISAHVGDTVPVAGKEAQ